MNIDFYSRFQKVLLKIEESGNAYAEAKGQSWQMQELKHSVLSKIISELGDMPVSRAETIARSSEEFKEFIIKTSKAIESELKLKCEYEKWKASFEALRSLSSLEKKTQEQIEQNERDID